MKRKENKRYIMQKAKSFSSITRCYATLPPKPPTYWRQVSRDPHTFVIHLFQCGTCQITKALKVVDRQTAHLSSISTGALSAAHPDVQTVRLVNELKSVIFISFKLRFNSFIGPGWNQSINIPPEDA